MFKVYAVPPPRSAVLTVFRGATAINDGSTAEPRRSWRCHCGFRTSTAVAPRLRCDGGIMHVQEPSTLIVKEKGLAPVFLDSRLEHPAGWICVRYKSYHYYYYHYYYLFIIIIIYKKVVSLYGASPTACSQVVS